MSAHLCRARSGLLAFALAVSLVLPAAALATARPAQVDESLRILFARAEALLRGGDPAGALPALDRVIDRFGEDDAALPEASRLLLQRSLLYRALARWRQGNRDVNDDLDRLVELAPRWEPTEEQAPEGLVERFAERRARKVGYLRITLTPTDARVRVNGTLLDALPDLLPVLAGEHVVTAERAGYAPGRAEVQVRAERTEGVALQLQRSNATIQLATVPAGATVVVDGDVIGQTVAAEASGTDERAVSAPVMVAGLLPGWHEVEVTLADHRPYRQRVELPSLGDFDLGVVTMERSLGVVVLRNLPADVTVRVDGEPRELERQVGASGEPLGEGPGRLVVPIGAHEIFITGPGGGVYEASIVVPDGETVGLDVRVRPGLGFLGVVGGDDLDSEGVRGDLSAGLAALDGWFLLDRARDGVRLLSQGGIDLGQLQAADARGTAMPWRRVQEVSSAGAPAGVFLMAVLPAERPASFYDVWIWTAAPGPPIAARRRIPLGDPAALETVLAAFRSPLPAARAWLGATLMDGQPGTGPAVIDVDPNGPAGRVGLRVGDRIRTANAVTVGTVAEFHAVLASASEFGGVAVEVSRGGTPMNLRLLLGTGPAVPALQDPSLDPVVWSALAAGLAAGTWETPVWALELGQARLLLRARMFDEAADLLRRIEAPEGAPFGRGAVDYWLALALLSGPEPDIEAAREALTRAAGDPSSRLLHNDGPRIQPRARGRLAALEASDSIR